MKFGAILLSALVTSVFNTEAAPTTKNTTAQYVFQVSNSTAFCSFLPSQPGQEVAANEKTGVPFCTQEGLGGQIFPQGFIQRVNFTSTDTFVQVRANINASAYSLQSTDGGGQYDYHDVSGQCVGYPYFVNLVEPDTQDLCIRCCQVKTDCNINVSGYGCNRVIPEVDSSGSTNNNGTTTGTDGSDSGSDSDSSDSSESNDAGTDSDSDSDSTGSIDSTSDPTGSTDGTSDPTESNNPNDSTAPTDGTDGTSDSNDSTDSSDSADTTEAPVAA